MKSFYCEASCYVFGNGVVCSVWCVVHHKPILYTMLEIGDYLKLYFDGGIVVAQPHVMCIC